MTIVRNRLHRPGGIPAQARTRVAVWLRPPGFYPANIIQDFQIAGAVRPNVDSDGEWSLDLIPSASLFPEGTFYEARQQVDDMTSSWPFLVPGPVAFTGGSRTSNVVTLVGLPADHGLQVGDTITVDAADNGYDGTFTVASAPLTPGTTITYAQTAANDTSAGAGTVTKSWDLVELVDLFVAATWDGQPITWDGDTVLWSAGTQPPGDQPLVQVADTVLLPGGTPLWNRVRLDLRLRRGGWTGAPDQTEVLGTTRILPDSTGTWQLGLAPTDTPWMAPSGAYYELRQQVGDQVTVYRFRVPAAWQVIASHRTGNTVTVEVDRPLVGWEAFDLATLDVGDSSYDGSFFVNAPSDDTTVSWTQVAADDPDGGGGTLTKSWTLAELVEFYPA